MSYSVELAPMAEFAYNNFRTTTNAHLPFYMNYGLYPNTGTSQQRIDRLAVTSNACGHWLTAIHDDCND
jgi:hypothetical protein